MILSNKTDEKIDIFKIHEVVEKYKDIEGSLITILQETQSIYGYLPIEAIIYIAKETKIKPAKILGVATFYTQFRLSPVGKNVILLCQGTACHVNGSEKVYEAVSTELNIKDGETTLDGLFTINNVACLGCCSLSPVMMINGETYGSLTPEKAVKIIKDLALKEV